MHNFRYENTKKKKNEDIVKDDRFFVIISIISH